MVHLDQDHKLQLIRHQFYWPKMEDDVRHFVSRVCSCVKSKKPHIVPVAPILFILSSASSELIGLDFLHFYTCSGGYKYFLLLTDHFPRFVQVYATTSKSAKIEADCLYNDSVFRYGIPGKTLHDGGKEFENSLFPQLFILCGIKRLRAVPYHPRTNRQTKRMNQTLISMLKTLPDHHKTQWRNHINKLIHAYNCTKHVPTGFASYYLMFGRSPRLPIDLIMPTATETLVSRQIRLKTGKSK